MSVESMMVLTTNADRAVRLTSRLVVMLFCMWLLHWSTSRREPEFRMVAADEMFLYDMCLWLSIYGENPNENQRNVLLKPIFFPKMEGLDSCPHKG